MLYILSGVVGGFLVFLGVIAGAASNIKHTTPTTEEGEES